MITSVSRGVVSMRSVSHSIIALPKTHKRFGAKVTLLLKSTSDATKRNNDIHGRSFAGSRGVGAAFGKALSLDLARCCTLEILCQIYAHFLVQVVHRIDLASTHIVLSPRLAKCNLVVTDSKLIELLQRKAANVLDNAPS